MAVERAHIFMFLEVDELIEHPDPHAAIIRAQEHNARWLQDAMRHKAEVYVGSRGKTLPVGERSERSRTHEGRMVDNYFAEAQGLDVVGYNNTSRADFFEFGTPPHPITASGLLPRNRGRSTPPRGLRGQFTRGANALSFRFADGGSFIGQQVDHPGQEGIPVMAMALEESTDYMAENIERELAEELSGG